MWAYAWREMMRIMTLRYLASKIRKTSESVCPLLAMKMAGFQSFIWYFISRMAGKKVVGVFAKRRQEESGH